MRASACAGFLLAVLWFDLMFDIQVAAHKGRELPVEVLDSIAGYYRRVTSAARPMNLLIACVMVATLAALACELARGQEPSWVGWASIVLAGAPILIAATRAVPAATRLGQRAEASIQQSALARSIWREHLFCLGSITALLVLQLTLA